MPSLVVATFNAHGGVDGWGRPFDLVEVCRELDADVLFLQEAWSPTDGPAQADTVATALGYEVVSRPMAPVVLYPPLHPERRSWGPPRWPKRAAGIRGSTRLAMRPSAVRGTVCLAVLWRVPARPPDVVDLGRLGGDRARRIALLLEVDGGPGNGALLSPRGAASALTVVGTHMSHIRHGSPVQLRRLHRVLPPPQIPGVVVGDMNMWGPPVTALLPGWSRAVRGRTWPAPSPLFQIDHILVNEAVRVERGEVVRIGRSDHYPLRAELHV